MIRKPKHPANRAERMKIKAQKEHSFKDKFNGVSIRKAVEAAQIKELSNELGSEVSGSA